ncbi:MAG: hypothetical protein JO023_00065 [Chloroflexi bacterium]|nr:hypothetical protein [Chloroflexota bacterium]
MACLGWARRCLPGTIPTGDEFERLVGPPPHRISGIPSPETGVWRTMLYTPGVTNTPRIIEREIDAI